MSNMDRGAPANLNSGKAWSPVDISDLRHGLARGYSVEETADFLCRDAADRSLAMQAAERAQLETDEGVQSRIYALAEGYLLLAESELKTADRQQPAKRRQQITKAKRQRRPRQ